MSYKQSILVILCLSLTLGQAQKKQSKTTAKIPCFLAEKGKSFKGFFDFNYDDASGAVYLKIDRKRQLEQPFLYVNGLSAGIGSNDIGLRPRSVGQ